MGIQLTDVRKKRVISLPSFAGSEVEIVSTVLVGDVSDIDFTQSEFQIGIKTLPKLITGWNFTDEKGVTLPINDDSIKLLPATDVQFLVAEVKKLLDEEKKT